MGKVYGNYSMMGINGKDHKKYKRNYHVPNVTEYQLDQPNNILYLPH
jgi:hypothetical protein